MDWKNSISTIFSVANSGDYPNTEEYENESFHVLKSGEKVESVIYFTNVLKDAEEWCTNNSSVYLYQYGGIYFIIPKQD